MSAASDPFDDSDPKIVWVAHGRRDHPPGWLLGWERARRCVFLVGSVLVVLASGLVFLVGDAVLLRGSLTIGWFGLLLMIAALWQPARMRVHAAWLTEMRPPMDDRGRRAACTVASCTCGWQSPRRGDLTQAVADAAAHAARLDPDVERLIS